MTVFISDAVHTGRLAFGATHPPSGPASREFAELSALYQASLVAAGHAVQPVLRPEIYQTAVARQALGVADGDWHLAVKPIEHFRPFHGLPNVLVCNWPYPELSVSRLGPSPFSDQVRLLNQADAVACCTGFTAEALRAAGVQRVVVLPPHVPGPAGIARKRPDEQVFLTVADIDRLPRQLGRTIEGFAQARALHGGLRLVVRLLGAPPRPAAALRSDVLQALEHRPTELVRPSGKDARHDEQPELPSDSLRSEQALALGESDGAVSFTAGGRETPADFFLCASAAEGLPVPLVQAMLAGVPLVTTMSSGIGSFLVPGSAVAIETLRAAAHPDDEPMARRMRLTVNPPTAQAVRDAVLAAASLDGPARANMAATCRHLADRHFGLAAFQSGLAQLDRLVAGRR